jgi:hypothetical protein
LDRPAFACFVHHDGIDTLLICDWGNDRVVEVTVRGEFMRAIAQLHGVTSTVTLSDQRWTKRVVEDL